MNEETKSGNAGALSADSTAAADARTADPGVRTEPASRPLPEDALIILPVRNVVMFPGMVFPLTVGRDRSRVAVQEALRRERPIGVLLQRNADVEEPGPDDLHWVGTDASVLRYITTP
jgi:ATP-dependent Lon protease